VTGSGETDRQHCNKCSQQRQNVRIERCDEDAKIKRLHAHIQKATERGAHCTRVNTFTFNTNNIRKMSKEKTNDPEETARKKKVN